MTARIYAVYILATRKDGPLYIGITNDLERRIAEHTSRAIKRHAAKYNIDGSSMSKPSRIRTRRSNAKRF